MFTLGVHGNFEIETEEITMKKFNLFAVALMLTAILFTGCQKDEALSTQPRVSKMSDLKVDPNFLFATTTMTQFDLAVALGDAGAQEKFLFSIYDKSPNEGGRLIDRGMADGSLRYRSKMNLPAALKSVYVVMRSSFGRNESKVIELNGGVVTAAFNQAQVGNVVAGRTNSGPNCTSGCTITLNANTNGYTINAGQTVCVAQGVTLSGNVTFNGGGRLRVCGNFNPNNINLNGGAKMNIVITSTGQWTSNQITMNGNQDTILNYGSVNVGNNLIVMGYFLNANVLTVENQFNVNSGGYFENTGTATAEDMNNNQTVVNRGLLINTRDFRNNGQSNFSNACRHIVQRDFHQNKLYANGGYVDVADDTRFNGGGITTLSSGSFWKTGDTHINGYIGGLNGSYALLRISGTTNIGGGSIVIGNVNICDVNGIEVNNGTQAPSVKLDCNVYIASSACNPGFGTPPVTDTDGDGVPDTLDEYPNDSGKAFNAYFPAQGVFGNVSYEDNWPAQADYDLNDLVIAYNYKMVKNANNQFVQIVAGYKIRAFGAQMDNGFGVSFDFNPSAVGSVTGTVRASNFISDHAKGYENGHTNKTVVVIFDAVNSIFNKSMTNTLVGGTTQNTDTATVVINLSTPQASIGTAPFNHFLISNRIRGREVHLKGYAPTALADMSLFNTREDKSIPNSGIWYQNGNGLPWAIDIPQRFDYPTEYSDILGAYLKFQDWAQSNGTLYPNWYQNLPGYRNANNIY